MPHKCIFGGGILLLRPLEMPWEVCMQYRLASRVFGRLCRLVHVQHTQYADNQYVTLPRVCMLYVLSNIIPILPQTMKSIPTMTEN